MDLTTMYGRTPTVFVSSTCYDLKQVRIDIRDFISNQLGYEAILSEFDSFPLEPEITAVENCIRVVKQRADIFCLIIGGRYGSVTDSGKSITNLEYVNAKAKGIPIYVFVDKSILAILPVWEKNKTADYSNIVDSTQLFEFVANLRGQENIWTYGFENAQDIVNTLRKQLGYLFFDALTIRGKIHVNNLTRSVQKQEGNALKIIIEKPDAWEYLLLGEVLEHSIAQHAELKSDLVYGFSFGDSKSIVGSEDVISFISSKTEDLLRIIHNLNILFESVIPDAVGAPGEPGDEEKIVYVGQRFGNVYEALLRWGLEFKSLSIEEEWMGVVNAVSKMWESPTTDIDNYMVKYKQGMKEVVLHLAEYSVSESSEAKRTIDLNLTLESPDMDEFNVELEKLKVRKGI